MSAPPRRQLMMTWQGVESTSLESVRLLLADSHRLRATGRLVAAATAGTEAFNASYEVAVNESGAVKRLLLRSTTAEEERQVSFSHSHDGFWLFDHGQGSQRAEFDGALDVDVAGCVLFNTLPIRRLGLHRQAGEHQLPVVYVSLPDLAVRVVHQTYTTVDLGEAQSVVRYADADFTADLTVDSDAVVIDYPGLSRRI